MTLEPEHFARPARLTRVMRRQIIEWADPISGPVPEAPDPVSTALILAQAEQHGVLPAVLRRLRPVMTDPELIAIRETFATRFSAGVAFTMLLRSEARKVLGALDRAGVPALLIKGQDFADHLYPDPLLRPTSDIDLLVPVSAYRAVEAIVAGCGFNRAPVQSDDGMEIKWLHVAHEQLLLEIQGNLVHAPALRSALSLGFADLCPDGDPASANRPAARLAIAAVHAASSHHFEKLRLVVDVLQAARMMRGSSDEQDLEDLVSRTGIRLALVAALDLAGRLYDDKRPRGLADGLRPARYRRVARLLIDESVVMAMETRARGWQSWRRSLFRELLKQNAGRAARSSAPD